MSIYIYFFKVFFFLFSLLCLVNFATFFYLFTAGLFLWNNSTVLLIDELTCSGELSCIFLCLYFCIFCITGRLKQHEQKQTHMFSSPMMQKAERIFTISVIMWVCLGSMALANSNRLRSSPRILCSPYCKTQTHTDTEDRGEWRLN